MCWGLESSSARMNAIGRSKLLRGHAVDPQDVIRKIEAVTKDDVERAAHRMFGRPFFRVRRRKKHRRIKAAVTLFAAALSQRFPP